MIPFNWGFKLYIDVPRLSCLVVVLRPWIGAHKLEFSIAHCSSKSPPVKRGKHQKMMNIDKEFGIQNSLG